MAQIIPGPWQIKTAHNEPPHLDQHCLLSLVFEFSIWYDLSKTYRKNSKIWDTSNNCHNCPKNRKGWCNIAIMHPKDADGMANSEDPDQTASSEAVWSWSALFAETYLSQYIEFVRYFEIMQTYILVSYWCGLRFYIGIQAIVTVTSIIW